VTLDGTAHVRGRCAERALAHDHHQINAGRRFAPGREGHPDGLANAPARPIPLDCPADGARSGDVLAVTGPLGASRAGLLLPARDSGLTGTLAEEARRAHCRPPLRWREGVWLGVSRHVHAMMDLSDGLSTDLARMCRASNCAAVVTQVPVARSARAFAENRKDDPDLFAAAGGEDFELLAAVDSRAFGYLAARFRKRFGRDLLPVGEARSGSGVSLWRGLTEMPLERTGWEMRGIKK